MAWSLQTTAYGGGACMWRGSTCRDKARRWLTSPELSSITTPYAHQLLCKKRYTYGSSRMQAIYKVELPSPALGAQPSLPPSAPFDAVAPISADLAPKRLPNKL